MKDGTTLVAPSQRGERDLRVRHRMLRAGQAGADADRRAGWAWHMAQLLPLNVGPRPLPVSAPAIAPETESTSSKTVEGRREERLLLSAQTAAARRRPRRRRRAGRDRWRPGRGACATPTQLVPLPVKLFTRLAADVVEVHDRRVERAAVARRHDRPGGAGVGNIERKRVPAGAPGRCVAWVLPLSATVTPWSGRPCVSEIVPDSVAVRAELTVVTSSLSCSFAQPAVIAATAIGRAQATRADNQPPVRRTDVVAIAEPPQMYKSVIAGRTGNNFRAADILGRCATTYAHTRRWSLCGVSPLSLQNERTSVSGPVWDCRVPARARESVCVPSRDWIGRRWSRGPPSRRPRRDRIRGHRANTRCGL